MGKRTASKKTVKTKKTKTEKTTTPATPARPPQVTPYPQAGRKVDDFEQELDRQLSAGKDEQPTKRGPGRPRKDVPSPEPVIDLGSQLQEKVIDRILRIPFSAWAEFAQLPELSLTDREAGDLAAATKDLLDYYLPNLPPVLIMWSNFTAASLVILQPRFRKIAELKKQKQAENAGQEGRQPVGQGRPKTPAANTKFPTKIKTEKL